MEMQTFYNYLRTYANELGRRIVDTYPPLHAPNDPPAPELSRLLRKPLPAQELAIMGCVKYLADHDAVKVVGECGTGKTFMAGAGVAYVAAHSKPFSTIVMCPPHLTEKWAREILIAVPHAKTYIIEDLRNGGDQKKPHGVVEIQYINGLMKRKGLATSLPQLRSMGRKQWLAQHPYPTYFIVGKEKGKLGYYWKHVYGKGAQSSEHAGSVVNIDTALPVAKSTNGILTYDDFDDRRKHSETVERSKGGTRLYSPLWSADRAKIQRMAPMDYMGRYMLDFFDFSIADEVHQLSGDTAQGNSLAVLARIAKKVITLTGTMMGGYADDLYNVLYRIDAPQMVREGFEWGGTGREMFQRKYGVIETVEKISENENSCSRNSKKTIQILRRPGCSPMLFGNHLMNSTAFVSLEDVADALPPYTESVLEVDAGKELGSAYEDLAEQIKRTIAQYPKDKGLRSIMLNTLLCYPDHPFGWDTIYRKMWDRQAREYVTIKVAEPDNLNDEAIYPKERELINDIRAELAEGRKCQVFATYTGKHDVVGRLDKVLRGAGFRVAVLRSSVATDKREAWYTRQMSQGVDVVVCHPRLVETGLDLLFFPTLYFYQTGYSTYTLRQASRRSWRIGQRKDVRVKFFSYAETMQSNCIRLMGRKVLVSMMMEGKFSGEGLAGIEEDTDMMSAMARELVEQGGVGETADDVWRQVNQQRAAQFENSGPALVAPAGSEVTAEVAEVPLVEEEMPLVAAIAAAEASPETPVLVPTPTPAVSTGPSLFDFARSAPPKRRKKPQPIDNGQLMLFAA
jgi:hypothetical protein